MKVIRKDAAIANTDDEFPGSFEVVLSAPTKDRDGETLLPEEWKTPLPDRITFDIDHGMTVGTTVGSGAPSIDDEGRLIVRGSYSSLPRAQEVRTLVGEGHIDRTSVAFMTEPSETKDGKKTVVRELLNGAFVAIPSNREAVVLSSKAAEIVKAGARNSASDAEHIQAIHDHALALGATADTAKSARRAATGKSIVGSLEATQDRVRDALSDAYGAGAWVWLRATMPGDPEGSCVFVIEHPDSSDSDCFQQSYTDDGQVVTLTGERKPVDVAEVVTPDPDEDTAQAVTAPAPAKAAPAPMTDSPDIASEVQKSRATALAALANLTVPKEDTP